MSFSLIYICRSFRGGILPVVFPIVARCFWPAENLECPCLFPDLILFPFLLLFFYIVPYPSFSSMFFSLIYICCSFRGGILSVVFSYCSHIFLTHREPVVPLSLFRSYPLPFSPPFLLYCSLPFLFFYVFSLIYICCSFRGAYSLSFSPAFLLYCSLPFLFFYVFFIDLYLP